MINEWKAKNSTGIMDEDGDHSDWVEIFNGTGSSANLGGFGLTDNSNELHKWTIPSVSIPANGFLLIFCSGKDRSDNELHTNFKLSSSDEVILSDGLDNIVSQRSVEPISYDISEGSIIDGAEVLTLFYRSTPGTSNLDGTIFNELTGSRTSGFYTEPFHLSVTGSEVHQIHFTMDGSTPETSDPIWSGPLTINDRSDEPNGISDIPTTAPNLGPTLLWESPSETVFKGTVLSLRSFDTGIPSSHTLNLSYFIDPLGEGRYSLAVVSLITDSLNLFSYDTGIYVPGIVHDNDPDGGHPVWGTGNYHEGGDSWERHGHFQLFDEEGDLIVSQDLGMQIHGAGSAALPQKSIRLYAREKYGETKINAQLFPKIDKDEFDVIIIRNMGQDLLTGVSQDVLANQLVKPLHQTPSDYRPVVVFVNGEYWGIQNLRERFDKHFLSEYHELPEDSIDLIDSYYGSASEGDNQAFLALYQFLESSDLSLESNYAHAASRIDIDDFMDNTLARIYLGCYDWPGNNIKIWRERSPQGKFRWLMLDNDGCLGNPEFNSLEHATEPNAPGWPNPPESTLFLRKLLENDGFKHQFIQRMAELLNTAFDKVVVGSMLSELYFIYAPEYAEHHSRWNMLEEGASLEGNYEAVLNVIRQRSCFVREHFINYFNLSEAEFPYNCDSTQMYLNVPGATAEYLSIYPNPNEGQFSLVLPKLDRARVVLKVMDMLGRCVHSEVLTPDIDIHQMNLEGVSSGVYSIQVQLTDRFVYGSVVVNPTE